MTSFMEEVIYEGGHVPVYDPEETQSQDGRGQFTADEEADDRADYDHGDSWHEDNDIYVEGEGEEEESNDVDISGAIVHRRADTKSGSTKEEEEHSHRFIHTR